MPLKKILENPEAFNQLMEETDKEMKNQNIAIQARVLAAGSIISKKFQCSISDKSPEGKAIIAWVKNRYGDRLKMDFDIGKTIVEISHDLYRVKLRLVLGFVKVNVLEWIEGATPDLLKSLPSGVLDSIGAQIIDHYRAYQDMQRLPDGCTADLKIAVDQLMHQNPEYGLSRWASLQAAEKTLKAYIKKLGGNPPTGGKDAHSLSALNTMAESLGLPATDKAALSKAQCSAGIRYDAVSTKDEAYSAYCAAIKICRHVAVNFPA